MHYIPIYGTVEILWQLCVFTRLRQDCECKLTACRTVKNRSGKHCEGPKAKYGRLSVLALPNAIQMQFCVSEHFLL